MDIPSMQSVYSSNIESVGWDRATSQLHVRFTSNNTYVYENVPEYVYLELVSAISVGSYFNRKIKNQFDVLCKMNKNQVQTKQLIPPCSSDRKKLASNFDEEMAELGLNPNDFSFKE